MKKTLAVFILFTLSACASPEEIAARKKQQEQDDIQTCQSYGLKLGSEAFGTCRLQLDLARQQRLYDRSDFDARPPGNIYHIGR